MIGNAGTELKCLVVKLHLPKVLSLLIRKGYLRLTTSTELLMDCCVGLFCCCFFKKNLFQEDGSGCQPHLTVWRGSYLRQHLLWQTQLVVQTGLAGKETVGLNCFISKGFASHQRPCAQHLNLRRIINNNRI